jgi:hypothetical protein
MFIVPILRGLLVVSLAAAAIPQGARGADCIGNSMLILRDSQSGFVGKTGTVWTINPDCSFTVSRFVNEAVSEPHKRGELTTEQKSSLSRLLSDSAISQLPAQIGEAPAVNARQITLSHENKTSVLNAAAGSTDAAIVGASGPNTPARRLMEIFQAVKRVTGADS